MTDNKTIHAASATHALPHKKKFKVESPVFKIVAYLFLLCFTAGVLVPFYVVIATSITEYTEIMSAMEFIWWPDKVSFESYISLLGRDRLAINGVPSLLRGFFNTMWIVVPSMLLNLFSSGLAAYAYSKLRFKAKKVMYGIMLATMVIPGAALTMPSYLYYDALGWTHTVLPMMIPGMLGGAGTVFFLRLPSSTVWGTSKFTYALSCRLPYPRFWRKASLRLWAATTTTWDPCCTLWTNRNCGRCNLCWRKCKRSTADIKTCSALRR